MRCTVPAVPKLEVTIFGLRNRRTACIGAIINACSKHGTGFGIVPGLALGLRRSELIKDGLKFITERTICINIASAPF